MLARYSKYCLGAVIGILFLFWRARHEAETTRPGPAQDMKPDPYQEVPWESDGGPLSSEDY